AAHKVFDERKALIRTVDELAKSPLLLTVMHDSQGQIHVVTTDTFIGTRSTFMFLPDKRLYVHSLNHDEVYSGFTVKSYRIATTYRTLNSLKDVETAIAIFSREARKAMSALKNLARDIDDHYGLYTVLRGEE
ncbi:MAG: hypothetical protein KGH67_05440, partial [Candidatus Micrarchaeota archaeon]|nr:hypothetical protein [Candidatus Micrarchaeota archaeon]